MFTGLVEEVGRIESVRSGRVRIQASVVTEGLAVGDSVAVDGCCLTAVDLGPGWWEADLSPETLNRTTLANLRQEQPVNLERPLRLIDRLGGHLVQGHVDGIGEIRQPAPDLCVALDEDLARYVVEKGSIAVDGVSLTAVHARRDSFTVAVVPHTCEVTTLGSKRAGERVNLEVDVMAKYVERLVTWT